MKKIDNLRNILKKYRNVIIAYSGGIDSSFLLKVATQTLGNNNVLAVTATSPLYHIDEIKNSKKLPLSLGVKHILFETDILKDKTFISNSFDRCFHCKKKLFSKIVEIKKTYNFEHILDGSNKDDENDYRPGNKAHNLFNIHTPLKDAGLTKIEIRKYARDMVLSNFDKPSQACLASRIPYGEKITLKKLKKIEMCEKYLSSLAIKNIRVRDYEKLARIEVDLENLMDIIKHRFEIIELFKKAGYTYITLDIEGFRSGSMNESLKFDKGNL